MGKVLKGTGFVLRGFRESDKTALIENANDKTIYRYTLQIPYPYRKKDADTWIKECLTEQKQKKRKNYRFVVDVAGTLAGVIALEHVDRYKAEIGYWLGRKYRGKGIVTGAVGLVSRFGLKNIKLRKIYATVMVRNKASAKVLENNGFDRKGIMKKGMVKEGHMVDCLFYVKEQ